VDRAAALLPIALVTASACGIAIVRAAPVWVLPVVLVLGLGAGLVWIAASALWPAKADRRCPRCGENAIERVDATRTQGLACSRCGHVDETASGWILAEEEGPLEEIVLAERRRRRAGRAVGTGADRP
jgi:hypothetical protein